MKGTVSPAVLAKQRTAADGPQGSIAKVNQEFRATNPDHRVVLEWVDYKTLEIDPEIQRDEEAGEITHIVNNFNPAALGTLTISARIDEAGQKRLFVVDGQQRQAALTQLDYPRQVRALVHYNLTVEEEAALFLQLNYRRAVGAWNQFKARRKAKDSQALAIWALLQELGIPTGGSKGFTAIGTADKIYRQTDGADRLAWALRMVRDIYDSMGEGGCYDGRVIEAFSMVYAHYGKVLRRKDEEDLMAKLSAVGGGIKSLIGHGQTIKLVNGGHISTGIANAILDRFNKFKRGQAKNGTRLPHIGSGRRAIRRGAEALAEADVDTDE